MNSLASSSRPFIRLIPIAVLAAAFAHNLWLSWLKWGDMMVDAGKEYDQPLAILHGKMLYRDITSYYGPFSTYFNALLYKLFGIHANVLRAAGIVSAALMCGLLYRLGRRFIGRLPSTLVAAAFLYLCAFAHLTPNANYNFVVPYTYAATYGILAATASLFFLIRHAQKQRSRDFCICAAFLTLAALCKLEVFFAALVAHSIFIATALWTRRLSLRLHLAVYLATAALAVGVYGYFWSQAPANMLRAYVALSGSGHVSFIKDLMGLTDVDDSLKALAVSLLLLTAATVVVLLTAWLARIPEVRACIRAMLCFFVVFVIYYRSWLNIINVKVALRMIPLVLAVGFCALALRWLRRTERRASILPGLLLLSFGLACLPRLILRCWAMHFGFYLLPVGLLGFAVVWFEWFPGWLQSAIRNPQSAIKPPFAGAGAAIFLALALQHFKYSNQLYDLHTEPISGPRGTLLGFDERLDGFPQGRCYAEAVEFLSKLPPETRILTAPEGLAMVYLSGHDNPYPAFEWLGAMSDEEQLALWKSMPPDVVVLVDYHHNEPSTPRFGTDYALQSEAWIGDNYAQVAAWGRFIIIGMRKDLQ